MNGKVKSVSSTPELLTIEWLSGATSQYASLWLRDNRVEDRDQHSGQRLVDVADLPLDPRISCAVADEKTVRVQWESEPDTTCFPTAWLEAHATGTSQLEEALQRRLWLDGGILHPQRDFAWKSLAELRTDSMVRLQWMSRLVRDGIAFLREVPASETAILEAMSLVGRVCETNYGLVFDVRSVPQPENLAYSDLGLGLHTDNPYREPVPGFQALHALTISSEGGDSLFADGFALAEQLRTDSPEDFALLTTTPVPFQYRSKAVELHARRPLIQLTCDGKVSAVHYNNRSVAPLGLSARDTPRFYRAYRRFAQLLRVPRFQLKWRLVDGDLVVFDNQRVLHGRTKFSSANYPRHLRGCYLTRDSVYSETALLQRELSPEKLK